MMYENVGKRPKKLTKEWTDKVFAPVRDYIRANYPEEELEGRMAYLMFMGNYDSKFEYKNSVSRDRIVLDQEGKLVYCGPDALKYDYSDWFPHEGHSFDNVAIHPTVSRW